MKKTLLCFCIAAMSCTQVLAGGTPIITFTFESGTLGRRPDGWSVNENPVNGVATTSALVASNPAFGSGNKFLELNHTNTGTSGKGHNVTISGTNNFGIVGQVDLRFVVPGTSAMSPGYYQMRVGTSSSNGGTAFALAIKPDGLYRTDGNSDTAIVKGTARLGAWTTSGTLQGNTIYQLKMVYNNSSSQIAYTAPNGAVQSLTANSADVWLNGAWMGLLRKSGGTGGVGVPADTSITNFNFTSRYNTVGNLYVDDVTLSTVDQVALPQGQGATATVFSDTFDSNANNSIPQGWNSSEHSNTTTARVTADTMGVFQTAPSTNKFVDLYHAASNTTSGHSFFVPSSTGAPLNMGTSGQISFALMVPTGTRGLSTGLYRVRCGINPNNDGTTFALGMTTNGFYGIVGTSDTSIPASGTYSQRLSTLTHGVVYQVRMVYNNSANPITYQEGRSVAAGTLDLWISGSLVRAGIGKCGGQGGAGLANGTALTTLGFNSAATTVGSIYIDDVRIAPLNSTFQTNLQNLQQTLNKAAPGDVVVLNSGTYSDYGTIVFDHNSGTASPRITFKASNPGGVTFTGNMQLLLTGANLDVRDFRFDGVHNDASVVIFDKAANSKLHECIFKDIDSAVDYRNPNAEVMVLRNGSHHNTISKNTITGNYCQGIAIRVDPNNDPNNKYNTIEQNLFVNIPQDGTNGGESIQIGETVDDVGVASHTTVSKNVFLKADGDNETISVKSSSNYIRDNIFKACAGSVTLRSANDCIVERNYFKACVASGGVIRTYGTNHYVGYNYIDGRDEDDNNVIKTYMGIRIDGGHTVPSENTSYLNNTRNTYYNNTIVNVTNSGIRSVYGTPDGSNWERIKECNFYNNLIEVGSGVAFDVPANHIDRPTMDFRNNMIRTYVSGTVNGQPVSGAVGYTYGEGSFFTSEGTCLVVKDKIAGVDPLFSTATVDTGMSLSVSATRPYSRTDFDGEDATLNIRDIGCDEWIMSGTGRSGGFPGYADTAGATWWTGTRP